MNSNEGTGPADTGCMHHFAVVATLVFGLLVPGVVAAQWPFSPAGYFYPSQPSEEIDHITIIWKSLICGFEASGFYAKGGQLYRFVDYTDAATADNSKIRFEFETETIAGRGYRFVGQFHNNHVYEEYVTDPAEIVASGELEKLEAGSVAWKQVVRFTYLPKPRGKLHDVNQLYPSGKTDLVNAAARADIAKMRDLLAQGATADPICPGRETALQNALGYHPDDLDMVKMLLAAGADVNRDSSARWGPPLTNATSNPVAVELLLAAGAKVNAADDRGVTALMCAVPDSRSPDHSASRESVKLLLRAGADVNVRDKFGRTALILARRVDDPEIVAALLQAGADDEPSDCKARYARLLREHLAILKDNGDAQPPCDTECQRLLRERVVRELGIELPREYYDLLGVTDGLYYHWLRIFASRTSGFRSEGIVEANLELWSANLPQRPFLFLGTSDRDLCAYEIGTGKYLRLRPYTLEKRAEASSFEELMADALERNLRD